MRYLELLAPARDINIGIAAIDCGADAVYIAGPAFGARQAAGNEVQDIARLCSYAHRFGARVFVTVNTIIYDGELEEAARLVEELRGAGVDAIIAQDLALLPLACGAGSDGAAVGLAERRVAGSVAGSDSKGLAERRAEGSTAGQGSEEAGFGTDGREKIKPLPLHASTQCSIRTPEKAAEIEAFGFSRVTLERELSLDQIRSIASAVQCEVECFVHGALCVCYSGQCYLSEMLSGRSANRGACIQACRSRYDVTDREGNLIVRNKAVLSLRDLRLKARLSELADAGVTSFKIEGRLKNISYVRNAVREYSLALDSLVAHSHGRYARASFGRVVRGFIPDTVRTFNRGYTELFLDGVWSGGQTGAGRLSGGQAGFNSHNASRDGARQEHTNSGKKVAAMDAAKGMGELLGSATAIGRDFRSFKVLSRRRPVKLANGDGLAFVSREGEVVGVRADVCEGDTVRCKRIPELYEGAMIFRNYDSAFEKSMTAEPCVRLLDAVLSAEFIDGTLRVTARSEDGRRVERSYTDLWTEFATNPDRIRSMWQTQLSKTSGIFSFTAKELRSTDQPSRNAENLRWTGQTGRNAENLRYTGQTGRNAENLRYTGQTGRNAEKPSNTNQSSRNAEERLPLLSAATMNSIRADMAAALSELPCRSRRMYENPAARKYAAGQYDFPTAPTQIRTDNPTNNATGRSDSLPDGKILSENRQNTPILKKKPLNATQTDPTRTVYTNPKPRKLNYKDNVANALAAKVYTDAGFTVHEQAYELTHRDGAELMRTKYCLRRELGLCPNANLRRETTLSDNTRTRDAGQNGRPLIGQNETSTRDANRYERKIRGAEPLHLTNNGSKLTAIFDCLHCEMVIKSAGPQH